MPKMHIPKMNKLGRQERGFRLLDTRYLHNFMSYFTQEVRSYLFLSYKQEVYNIKVYLEYIFIYHNKTFLL